MPKVTASTLRYFSYIYNQMYVTWSWIFLKIFPKKKKNFKAIWVVLDYSKPKFFLLANHGDRYFFKPCPRPPTPRSPTPTILVLLRPWIFSINFSFWCSFMKQMFLKNSKPLLEACFLTRFFCFFKWFIYSL